MRSPVTHLDLVYRHSPLPRRGFAQHPPGSRANPTHGLVSFGNAGATTRHLDTGPDAIGWVRWSKLEVDVVPRDLELLGDQLGNRRGDTLPHLRTPDNDLDRAVGVDPEKRVRSERRVCRRHAGTGEGLVAHAQREPGTRNDSYLDESTARKTLLLVGGRPGFGRCGAAPRLLAHLPPPASSVVRISGSSSAARWMARRIAP